MEDNNEETFEVLEALYFVTSFQELSDATGFENARLARLLQDLFDKGWVRCYDGIDNEVIGDEVDIRNRFANYHYLASKEGLFAHNSR
jgi:hypothetical protein